MIIDHGFNFARLASYLIPSVYVQQRHCASFGKLSTRGLSLPICKKYISTAVIIATEG